ncbi:MAG: trypsin-like serine protease [Saprospiraceae bacterium]|nr:trypsin-like serine protease [Saprospiraceae bacterium]
MIPGKHWLIMAVTSVLLVCVIPGEAIIVRHDTPEADHQALAARYPATCHFADGSGTLIADTWVLTAAHVAQGLQRSIERGETVQVECSNASFIADSIVIHPAFRPVVHDIALVRLSTPVQHVTPVPLFDDDETGALITIVGRGDHGTGLTGPVRQDRIDRAATNLVDGVDAHWLWFDFDNPFASDVTPLEGVSGPGDSGGPAYVDVNGTTHLIGVSSHQRSESRPGRYGAVEYYARVSQYVTWIRNVVH